MKRSGLIWFYELFYSFVQSKWLCILLTFFKYILRRELPVWIPLHWFGGGWSESWEACLEGYIWPKCLFLPDLLLGTWLFQPKEWGWLETELALDLMFVWFSLEWVETQLSSTEFCLEVVILPELLELDLDGGSEGMYQENGELLLEGGRIEQQPSLRFFLSATSRKFVVDCFSNWRFFLFSDNFSVILFLSDFVNVSFLSTDSFLSIGNFLCFLWLSQFSFVLLVFDFDDVEFDWNRKYLYWCNNCGGKQLSNLLVCLLSFKVKIELN